MMIILCACILHVDMEKYLEVASKMAAPTPLPGESLCANYASFRFWMLHAITQANILKLVWGTRV